MRFHVIFFAFALALAAFVATCGNENSNESEYFNTPQGEFANSIGLEVHNFRCDNGNCILMVYQRELNWNHCFPIYARCNENECEVVIPKR